MYKKCLSPFLKRRGILLKNNLHLRCIWLIIPLLGLCQLALAQKVTLNSGEYRVQDALLEIQKQTGVSILYDSKLINNNQKAVIDWRQKDYRQALDELLSVLNLEYKAVGGNILISRKPNPLKQAPKKQVRQSTVTGFVVDSEGKPLPGVTVSLKGAGTRVITDMEGRFSLNTTLESGILVFSFIGFETHEQGFVGSSSLQVSLKDSVSGLNEVVIVGYGSQRKKDVTGSVASLPEDRLDMVPNTNIAQALQGAVPGIVIQQSQGGANPQSSIMIRGRNSILASNNPLIIFDGIAYNGNLSDINVNDVASVEVLKDASAAAIYGSRGANGVILITSKKGVQGDPKIAYDGKYAFQTANDLPRFMSPDEFYEFKEIREPGKLTGSEQEIYENRSWSDWVDLALRDGSSQQHNLSVSGASNTVNYFLSGNFLDVAGQTVNDDYERITGKVGLQATLFNALKIGTNTNISSADFGGAPISWEDVLRINPLTKAYDDNGDLEIFPWQEYLDIVNPLEPTLYDYKRTNVQVLSNNFLELELPGVKGLVYRMNLGIHRSIFDESNYRSSHTAAGRGNGGYFTGSDRSDNFLSFENILNYSKVLKKHTIGLTGVYSYERYRRESSEIQATGFPNDFLGKYAIGQANLVVPSYDYLQTILLSQMLRLNYSYDSRYLLTLTARRDGFSGFGANKKWGIFPSVAVGWNVAEENFFPAKQFIQELKLRASYGLNGNQAVGAYETISRMREENLVSAAVSLPGYVPSKLGQDELGWENSKTLNLGLDFRIRKDALWGSINYYNTDTYDLLLNRTISPVHGITNITQNIGKTNNKGLEVQLNSKIVSSENFSWDVSGNLAFNKNKIISLYGLKDENGNEIDDLANRWFIGQPISINYDWKFAGVWQLPEAELAAEHDYEPGDAKFYDPDGDYQRSDTDRTFIGQRDPDFNWGFSSNVSYKNWGLNVFAHGIHGITKENRLMQDASSSSEVRRNVIRKNWWTEENPTNEYYANRATMFTVPIYQNASFIRIKDITLYYKFPSAWTEKVKVKNLRMYANLRNPFTFTNWTTNDPELDFGRGAAPLAREFVLGLNFDL